MVKNSENIVDLIQVILRKKQALILAHSSSPVYPCQFETSLPENDSARSAWAKDSGKLQRNHRP
jgi:hypothetical protein